ncbi:MAG: DedA family protein [Fidelibacterota bacterium]
MENELVYGILFLSAFLENVFPPIPGDMVVIFGAYLVGTKKLEFIMVYITTTAGSLLGFILMYFFGFYLGKEYFMRREVKFFPRKSIMRVEKWFDKYGTLVLIANRFLSGTRSVVSIFSGIAGISLKKVIFLSVISSALWNFIIIKAGIYLGENWQESVDFLKSYNTLVFSAIFILAAVWILRKFIFRSRTA